MHSSLFIAALAGGVFTFVYLYIFHFDQHTENELVRLTFYWAPLLLFGISGLVCIRLKGVSQPLVFAAVATLIGVLALAVFLMSFFLS